MTLKKENERQQAILNSQMNHNNVRTGQAIPLQPRINNPQSVKIEEHDIDRTHHVISPEPQQLQRRVVQRNICSQCINDCVESNELCYMCCGPMYCVCFICYLCIFRGGSEA